MMFRKITDWILSQYARIKDSKTTRHIALVYVGDVIAKSLTALTSIILIRHFTNTDYAGYTAFLGIAVLFYSLIGTGINLSMVRYAVELREKTGEKSYVINLLALLVESAYFVILASLVWIFPQQSALVVLGTADYSDLVRLSVFLGLGMLLFETGRNYILAEERFPVFVGFTIFKNLSILVCILILLRLDQLNLSVFSRYLLILQLLNGLLVISFGFRGIFKKIQKDWWLRLKKIFGEFISASVWLVAYGIIIAILTRLDVMMLSRFASEADLANYGVAFQFYSFAILLLASISSVLRPKFAKTEMQTYASQHRFLVRWIKTTVWVGIPVVLTILFAKPLFVLVVESRYEAAFSVLSILLVGVWLSLMLSPLVQILLSRKDFKFMFIASVIALAAGLLASYAGVRFLGAAGAALSMIVSNNIILQGLILWRVLNGPSSLD